MKWVALLLLLAITPNPSAGQTNQPHSEGTVVIATGYHLAGRKTATDKVVYPGCVALSRCLAKQLNAKFGDRIKIEGMGVYTYDDRSPQKFKHVDIHFPVYKDAYRFGKRRLRVWNLSALSSVD